MESIYFTAPFIQHLMREHALEQNIRVLEVTPLAVDNSASILVVLTAGNTDKLIGHFGLEVTYEAGGKSETRRMVLKVKPHGNAIVAMLNSLAQACGGELAEVYERYKALTGFQHTHMRELEVYGKLHNQLMPEIYGLHADPENGTYLILMEYLEEVELLNSVKTPEKWTDAHIRAALQQAAAWHATHLNKELPLDKTYWSDAPSAVYMQDLSPLWQELLQNAALRFPELYTPVRVQLLQDAIRQIPAYWQELERMPMTFVHNDLNPRNTCFKRDGESLEFCVYDWELSTWHVPQYDVQEFLCFVLDEDKYQLREEYLESYRKELHLLTGLFEDQEQFRRGFYLAAYDFGLHRLGMYMMAHSVSPYPFLPRVVNSFFNTLEQGQILTGFSNKAYLADS
ncbi:aminoglycoside phosphotransferase family protein [Pontibacter diazotrophicus]|uniref:Aminoglycoside phosphotransferase family protein n=1 Tax=Pontibacter diazotrophicus TaxID=1400979 RepID=A0A3D8LAW7_9BACT|nr:aminoglycoside phosphotransferase family protein [Pontibacter diazotrophicus]RDV14581.1 aminoglycoside phosphotransferase family protein [Pontibacter diazotrophicus]